MYVVYYTFCIIIMLCQDDKIEFGLAEIIKSAHIKRKKAVVSLFSATSRCGLNLVCRREDLFSWLKILLLKCG